MKLDARRVDAFLRDPGGVRIVLLFGDDVGLIRERSNMLLRAVAGSLDDPFRVTDLDRDGTRQLAEEMASQSLMGGRRVVRVREVADAATAAVASVLDRDGEALLVLEAPGLAARSKLRTLVERAPQAVSIGCYAPEGAALEQAIAGTLDRLGVTADAQTKAWLATQLGADWAVTRSELEKLALHVGPGAHIDMPAAQACVGDLAGLSLDDALFAATSGDVAGTDRALELAMAEGAAPVAALRAALIHLQRLQRAGSMVAGGAAPAEAARSMRPPVFFRREGAFVQALRIWPQAQLEAAAMRVWEAERACKRTGMPAEAIARSIVLGLARGASQYLRS